MVLALFCTGSPPATQATANAKIRRREYLAYADMLAFRGEKQECWAVNTASDAARARLIPFGCRSPVAH